MIDEEHLEKIIDDMKEAKKENKEYCLTCEKSYSTTKMQEYMKHLNNDECRTIDEIQIGEHIEAFEMLLNQKNGGE